MRLFSRRYSILSTIAIALMCQMLLFSSFVTVAPKQLQAAAANWLSVGPFGGRVRALAIDKNATDTIYAGTDNGIFKTIDDAHTWSMLTPPTSPFVAIDIEYPVGSSRIYAAHERNAPSTLDGVLRSSDGGANWISISAGLPSDLFIRTLAVNPGAPESVWLGSNSGVFRWNSALQSWEATTLSYQTFALAFAPGMIIAGVAGPESDLQKGGVYKSIDNGATWVSITGNIPADLPGQSRAIHSLAIDPRDPQVIYAGSNYGVAGGLYKTRDGGTTWISIANNDLDGGYVEYTGIAINPLEPDTVYVGTYGYFNANRPGGVFKSTDAGGSWTATSNGLLNVYIRTLILNPLLPNKLYVGTDGAGLHRTTNSAASWQPQNYGLTGLDISQITEINGSLYAATGRDGIYRSINQGQSWERFNDGLPSGISLLARGVAETGQGDIFTFIRKEQNPPEGQPTFRVGIYHLNGTTWEEVANNLPDVDAFSLNAVANVLILTARNTSNFNNPDEVFVSGNGGMSWSSQKQGLPTSTPIRIRNLQIRDDGSVITLFAATNQGLYSANITLNSSLSWQSSGQGIAVTDVYAVAVDPGNPDVLYAGTCGYIYKSINGGVSWTQRRNGLTDYCISTIAINPTDTRMVWAGGDSAIFQSINSGGEWDPANNNLATLKRPRSLFVRGNGNVFAGTLTGIWANGNLEPPQPQPRVAWTVLAYLDGDNNLDPAMEEAFNNLEVAAANPNIRIIALWDKAGRGDTVRYWVQPDTNLLRISNVYKENETKWTLGELNMGTFTTLSNFVHDARRDFPAEHYMLTIMDHGGGWSVSTVPEEARKRWFLAGSGLSWDETNGYSFLSTKDMGNVLAQAVTDGGKIDIVMYDACLMGMAEEAYQIRNGAAYLIASESQSWASFPYDKYLLPITQNTTVPNLAINIANVYHDSLPNDPRTMSVMDLSRAEDLGAGIDRLAAVLITALSDSSSKEGITSAYTATQKFDFNSDLKITSVDGYVDLADFAERLSTTMAGTPVADAARDLVTLIKGTDRPFVIHERHASGIFWPSKDKEFFDLEHAQGVSIYMPFGGVDKLDAFKYVGSNLELAAHSRWDEFIHKYLDIYPPQRVGREDESDDFIPRGPFFQSKSYLPLITAR
jgi:photosystem II stability/assembly factor-like uncharacterized protein